MTLAPPEHHKEIARFLGRKVDGDAKVTVYRDNRSANPVPIGEFGTGKTKLFSTIGAFDMPLKLPAGNYEFAAYGSLDWLPNAIASSIYWLRERAFSEWPLVCEDAVKQNVKSTYRHMAYVPSVFSLQISTGQEVRWLLGVPITEKELSTPAAKLLEKAESVYPEWLFHENA